MKNVDDLEKAIHIQNEYKRVAAPILEHFKEVSKPFIGKKITTLKGFTAKFYDTIQQSGNYFNELKKIHVMPLVGTKWANVHQAYVSTFYKDLKVEISLCFSTGNSGCEYEKRTYYFGKIDDNGILESINDNCKVDTELLNFEQELAAIKEYRKLEKAMEAAKDKIRVGSEVYKYITD